MRANGHAGENSGSLSKVWQSKRRTRQFLQGVFCQVENGL